ALATGPPMGREVRTGGCRDGGETQPPSRVRRVLGTMSAWRGRGVCLLPDGGRHVGGYDAEAAQHLLPRQHPAEGELATIPSRASSCRISARRPAPLRPTPRSSRLPPM